MAKGSVVTVKGTSFYFANRQVRIESDVVSSPDGDSVLVRAWDATTKTVAGFRAYVLVSDVVAL